MNLPTSGDPVRVFTDGCDAGDLLYQRCEACARVQTYPRTHCAACHGTALGWHRSERRGRLVSFTTVHRAANPAFQDRVPYALALVDVDEGFRLMMNVDHVRPLAIGDAVEITFARDGDGPARVRGVAS